ncbi:MAG: thioredoxin-disulfide reductase [Eubacteriales bacterium]|nr:thioredoxin-disulfide reductase [Eubacteriales bacterium]MDD3074802.1 thioredoxin-disulfide reductase [Eubacteriales bacterium]MDD4079462.1 thioredoxin-disulfide reductase [Eubacteriales bacterium]MDD4769627.1 thioredoxin-disulfide reductase [Eubacteriales bacterium]
MDRVLDVLVIGGGPAGLTAGLYAGRALLNTAIVEGRGAGGQVILTHEIENYPGFVEPISGAELAANMAAQTSRFDVAMLNSPVEALKLEGKIKEVVTQQEALKAKTVILATGVTPKMLGVPGEQKYIGRGVSYCATCDGAFFRGKKVAVVGGGDTAVKEALFLTKFAEHVWLIHRRDSLRAEQILQKRLLENPKITPLWNKVVAEIHGELKVTGVSLTDTKDESTSRLDLQGVFIFVGRQPEGPLAGSGILTDKDGYIITDESMATNIPGVYAVGDVRQKAWRQIVTAVGDGAIAALSAAEYIQENF